MGMDSLLTVGLTLKFFDQMSKGLMGSVNNCIGSLDKMQSKLKTVSQEFGQLGRASLGTGLIMAATLKKPLDAFTELEDAQTSLKATMMEKGGIIPTIFNDVDKVAKKLGNDLPGTTADFYNLAAGMNALKVSGESLANGALEAAAKLGVALKDQGVSYQETGEFVAKFKQAMGISDKDLVASMDTIQRLGHMGVKIEEMRYAFADLTGTLKPLGIQGLEAANKMAPLVGMFVGMGKSGRMVGNAIGDMMKAGFDTKKLGDANDVLAGTGIKLKFVDNKGMYMGVDNMLQQMDKLKNLSDAKRMAVAKALFGGLTGEQADMFNIMVTEGLEGYKKFIAAMERQADLNERVNLKLATLTNVWEAFTGTFKNTLAEIASSAAPTLKKLSVFFNDLSEKIRKFFSEHKRMASVLSHGVLALTAATVAFGGLALGISAVSGTLSKLSGGLGLVIKLLGLLKNAATALLIGPLARITGFKIFGEILNSGNALKAFVNIMKSAGGVFPWLIGAVRALSVALATTPVGWVALAIAAAAILIIQHWKPIKAFFGGLWEGIKEGFAPIKELFKEWAKVFKPLAPLFEKIGFFIEALFTPLDYTNKQLSSVAKVGKAVGKVLGAAFTLPIFVISEFVKSLNKLGTIIGGSVVVWYNLGASIVDALWRGIKSLYNKPIETIKALGSGIIGWFKKQLGIASPSKVFTDFGFQIAQGAALGMNNGLKNVSTAAKRMTQPIFQPMQGMPLPSAAGASGGGGGGVVINYSPTVSINGASPGAKEDFAAMLRSHKDEIGKMIDGHAYGKQRKGW